MNWRALGIALLLIIVVAVGGFWYRNKLEKPSGPVACTADAKVCADGTTLSRTGPNCTFPACPSPNFEIESLGLSFVLPTGYLPKQVSDPSVIAAFATEGSTTQSSITIRHFALPASTTAMDFIRQNAVLEPSDMPAPATAFSSVVLGTSQSSTGHRFSVVTIERFEGVIDIAYFLQQENEIIRFDANEQGVDWTNPSLDLSKLKANQDLRAMLSSLEGS